MPKYTNSFSSPTFIEETIVDSAGSVIGTIRIKPSSVLWKPKGAHQYFAVSLDEFAQWITSPGVAVRSKS